MARRPHLFTLKHTLSGIGIASSIGAAVGCAVVQDGELDAAGGGYLTELDSNGEQRADDEIDPPEFAPFEQTGFDDEAAELGSAEQALQIQDPDNPNGPPVLQRCFANLTGSFSVSKFSIQLGESVTLRWSARPPTGCSAMRFYVGSNLVSASGSMTLQPIANSTYSLRAVMSGAGQSTVGQATVNVILPQDVTISANNQASLLAQALATAGTRVTVQNHVQLDLTQRTLNIAAGVSLRGGRTARDAGPILFSTAPRSTLLEVAGDGVRISGLRIQGPDMGVPDGDTPVAIRNNSFVNLEIDNNEIYGWAGAAVGINDDGGRIDYALNPTTVRVHDNYIHHNQHIGRFGYGVVVGNSAYVVIERNVFDWNRHAIAGDGSDGSGYRALSNLVLENGGLHRWILGAWVHTHQFDMHGQDNCGIWDLFSDSLYNCGTAGHDMVVRHNTFLYTEDNAIKLRGTPQLRPVGAFVGNNVFAHDSFGDAVSQTESGLRDEGGNRFGIDGTDHLGHCDLDGDGSVDSFLATGQTWWYSSRGEMAWSYLNTSTRLLSEVSLGDFNGDARCDVLADGVIHSGGKPSTRVLSDVFLGGVLGTISAQ